MRTIYILLIFISLLFVLNVNNNIKEKEFKSKEDVDVIFSSIYKSNLEVYKNKL